ncbi:MAG: nucleoside deaminase [Pyrinomonadaceae bacterium]
MTSTKVSSHNSTEVHLNHLRRAMRLALEAEEDGNLPVGAIIVLRDEVVAEAGNTVLLPQYYPGGHAEVEALRRVPVHLWRRCREMTCYTTLEPCVMCMGALVLHGISRVVFGAHDPEGGAGVVLPHLPPYYAGGQGVPEWTGPLLPDLCAPLYRRLKERFDELPCGKNIVPEQ